LKKSNPKSRIKLQKRTLPKVSLNLSTHFHYLLNTDYTSTPKPIDLSVEYNFLFVSWVAPHLLFNQSRASLQKRRVRAGARMKKAYTMLTWLYYLTFTLDRQAENRIVKFSFLPRRRSMYTLTKAPMAHKTFSKEQFKFQLHKCKVSIRTELKNHRLVECFSGLQAALLITKSTFPCLETNTLFLKTARITFPGSAVDFYSYCALSRGPNFTHIPDPLRTPKPSDSVSL